MRKIRRGFNAIVLVIIFIMALTGCGIKQTNDVITHEAGQELKIDATTCFNVDEEMAAEFEFDTSKVDVNTVGEYELKAKYKDKEYLLTVDVVDTTAPMVTFISRCVFTNDLVNTDFTDVFSGVYDASEYTTKLVCFDKVGNIEVMNDFDVKSLTDKISLPCDEEELKSIGTEEVPIEAGIYRSVVEIKDIHENAVYEEVYVVYDTTGARIEDVPDKTVRVAKEDLDKEPEVDKSDYTITDNVDGKIKEEDIVCELELRDEDKHEWLVHVSYTDRAGNSSKADFLIIVKEKSSKKEEEVKVEDNTTSTDVINGTTGTGTIDPADADGDGVVTGEEASAYISPSEQAVIDAGYGNVVLLSSGHYGVLTHGDGYVNGVHGFDLISNHLKSIGLFAVNMHGGWIDSENDWYWFNTYNELVPWDSPQNPESGNVIWVN